MSVIACLALLVACGTDSGSILENVKRLEAKGDYAAAIVELNRGLREEPQSGQLRYQLGRMHSLAFDAAAAEHEFRKARELGFVEGGRVALGLGRALLQQGKYRNLVAEVLPAPVFEHAILASVHASRGHAFLALDQIEQAKQEIQSGSSLDATNADVALVRARFLAGGRNITGSLSLVDELLAREPGNLDALIHKAAILMILQRPDEAVESFARVIAIQPWHVRALVGRSVVLVYMGQLVEAQKDVEVLRKASPKHPASAYLRGQIHYWRGEYREALDMAQAALKVDEQDGPARLLSAMTHLMLETPTHAEHDFSRYVKDHPRDLAVKRVLTDLRAEIGRREREAKVLASIHADGLRTASVQAILGNEYVRVWQHSKVADWFERVMASQPPDPLGAVKQAKRRFSKEQLDVAAADLERVVALNDGSTTANAALALVHLARSDTAKAIDAAAAIEKKFPESAQAAALGGFVLMEAQQREEAERRFDEALRRDPKSISGAVGRARLDFAYGRPDMARKRFQDVLRADPENLQALTFYAHLEEAARRQSEAHILLDRAIKAHPSALEPKVMLVLLLRREDSKAHAVALADEVLEAHPNDPVAIEVAAEIQLWSGDADRSVATLRRLLKLLPRSPESYFLLARAQFKAGLKAEANGNLQRALELPIDEPETQSLPVFGIIDSGATLDAVALARKSVKSQPSAATRMQVYGESGTHGIGVSRFYDALSGGTGR